MGKEESERRRLSFSSSLFLETFGTWSFKLKLGFVLFIPNMLDGLRIWKGCKSILKSSAMVDSRGNLRTTHSRPCLPSDPVALHRGDRRPLDWEVGGSALDAGFKRRPTRSMSAARSAASTVMSFSTSSSSPIRIGTTYAGR